MQIRVRDLDPHGKFAPQLKLAVLARLLPPDVVQRTLGEAGAVTQRVRKLNLEVIVWLTIAMNLFADLSLPAVLARLSQGLRFLWPEEAGRQTLLPTKGALCQRRYQLRSRPLALLFREVCRPLATPATRGAFLGGLRLVALDGYQEAVPDTPANAAAFGRHHSDRGASAFPQVQIVALAECGTHAVLDASFWPCQTGEHRGAHRLLRSVTEGMLVLWDRGLHSYDLLAGVRARGAHVLARLPQGVQPRPLRRLADGTTLAELVQRDHHGRVQRTQRVRVITYTFTDPALPGYGQTYRLLTTLLDPQRYPGPQLAAAYHERWEIELTVDEQQTHLREEHLMTSPLRSRKPVGVIQELYGLLIAHYAVRYLMHEAALQADVDPDRLSFVHALRVIQDAVWQFQIVDADLLPGLYRRLLQDLMRELLPEREPRRNPRVVKRKMSGFPLKRVEHRCWPQPRGPMEGALQLI